MYPQIDSQSIPRWLEKREKYYNCELYNYDWSDLSCSIS